MFRLSRSTSPATRAPGTVSCIRFRQRKNVLLPQPDGPMMAVTARSRRSTLIPRTAWVTPNHAFRLRTSTRVGWSITSATWPSDGDPRDDADDEDKADEDDGAGPGERVPLVIRACRILEDLKGKRRDGRVE